MLKDLMAKLLAERLIDIGAEMVDAEDVDVVDDEGEVVEPGRWDELTEDERDFFTEAMGKLLDETFLASSVLVTQGDALLFVVNDPGITMEETVSIKESLEKLFDNVRVGVLVAGTGISVIKGQQPICGARIGEPIIRDENNQELNEQAQAPCILRGEHEEHENKHGVKWVVSNGAPYRKGTWRPGQNPLTAEDVFPTDDQI